MRDLYYVYRQMAAHLRTVSEQTGEDHESEAVYWEDRARAVLMKRRWWTAGQVAFMAGVRRQTAFAAILDGRLKAKDDSAPWLVSRTNALRWEPKIAGRENR